MTHQSVTLSAGNKLCEVRGTLPGFLNFFSFAFPVGHGAGLGSLRQWESPGAAVGAATGGYSVPAAGLDPGVR